MRCTRMIGGWAMAALLAAPGMASAAWDNVFQLTCCNSRPRTSSRIAFAAPAPNPCCCQPQVAFVQRSFYQPVTSFKAVAHWEPVTTNQTSFFWEPVQTVSFSCSIDPCTGCAHQVAVPQTSFQLRQQCNAVTNYVQRISYEPVTTMRQSFFLEPVTVNPCAATSASPVVTAVPVPAATVSPPTVSIAPPVTTENTVPAQTPPPPLNSPVPNVTEKIMPSTVYPRPAQTNIRPDRIASGSAITGTVVRSDYRPQANSRIRFVAATGEVSQPVTTDSAGRFALTLTSGTYKLYVDNAAGQPVFHSDFVAKSTESRNLMVVSR